MQCRKCGHTLKKGEKFCTVCGYYNDDENDDYMDDDFYDEDSYDIEEETIPDNLITFTDEKDFIKPEIPKEKEEETIESISKGEELEKAYIGEDYRQIKKGPFNIFAALFSWVYAIYRKLYITGILGLVLAFLLLIWNKKILIGYLVVSILLFGFGFNPFYKYIIQKRIKKIQEKYEGSDFEYIEENCEKSGGVNVVIALIIFAVFIGAITLYYIPIKIYKKNTDKFWEENSENRANCISLLKVAYRNIDVEQDGKVVEGVCSVITTSSPKKIRIYLKTNLEGDYIYIAYETNKDYLEEAENTRLLSSLRLKKLNGNITEEEDNTLSQLEEIPKKYNTVKEKSDSEEKMIEENKNTEERKNFIFNQEEITQ